MKIRYTIEFDDLKAFWQDFINTSALVRRQRIIFVISFAAIFLLLGLRLAVRDGSFTPLLVFALLGTVFLSLFWKFGKCVSEKRPRKIFPTEENKGLLCEHTLEVTDTGVIETTPVGQNITNWTGILRIVETPSHAFIYIGSNMAHVIPRARLLDGDMEGFIRELKRKLESQQHFVPYG